MAVSAIAVVLLLYILNLRLEIVFSPMTWSIGCIAVACLICFMGVGVRKIDVFEPVVIITAYLAFLYGARGIFILAFDPYYFIPYATPALLANALVLAVVGIIAAYFGYCSRAGDRLAEILPIPDFLRAGETQYPSVIIFGGAILGVLGVLARWAVGAGTAAPDVTAQAGTFWMSPFVYFLPTVLVLALLNGERRLLSVPRIAGVVLLSACVLVTFAAFSSKQFVIEPFVLILVLRHYRISRLRPATVLALVVGSFALTQCARLYMGLYSGHLSMLMSTLFQSGDSLWMNLFSRFYGLDSMAGILVHTYRGNYELGRSFFELFYWWIPRYLWPGKPYSWSYTFSFLLAHYNGPANAGVFAAPTVLGELYLNFGTLGLVLGSVGVGIVARTTYVYFVGRVPTKSGLLMYGVTLVELGQLCECTFAVAEAILLAHLAPLVCLLVCTRRLELQRVGESLRFSPQRGSTVCFETRAIRGWKTPSRGAQQG